MSSEKINSNPQQELNDLETAMSDKRSQYETVREKGKIMQHAIDMNDTFELVKNLPPELKELRLNGQTIEGKVKGYEIKVAGYSGMGIGGKQDPFIGEIDGQVMSPSQAQEIFLKFYRPLSLLEGYKNPQTKIEMEQNKEFSEKRKELMDKINAMQSKVDDILK